MMPNFIKKTWNRIFGKSFTTGGSVVGGIGSWSGFVDSYNRRRQPTNEDLLKELKNTAFTCAAINAATCASFPPRLFVRTGPGMPEPKCTTERLDRLETKRLKTTPWIARIIQKSDDIREVTEHPFLELQRNVNPLQNQHDLLELLTFYQDIFGFAYWLIIRDALNRPIELWPVPTQSVVESPTYHRLDPLNVAAAFIPDYYDIFMAQGTLRVPPENIIPFRYPDLRNPFQGGYSPHRAAYESIALNSEFLAHKQALWENRARPDAIVSPAEVIGEEERERLEHDFNAKFRRGGAGKILVAESRMSITPLSFNLNDTALLGEHASTKEDIANAFGVPLSYLTKDTNMANLQASDELYMSKTIRPKLHRRDEKITERLLPMYDPSRRLFVAAEDPVPEDVAAKREQERVDLEHGVRTINEVRAERALAPVKWGELPWLPTHFAPADPENPNRNLRDQFGDESPNAAKNRDVALRRKERRQREKPLTKE